MPPSGYKAARPCAWQIQRRDDVNEPWSEWEGVPRTTVERYVAKEHVAMMIETLAVVLSTDGMRQFRRAVK